MHIVHRSRLLDPDRLVRVRTMRGLTQRQLADASDLSVNTVWMYEAGEVDPSPAALVRLAAALDLPVLELSPLPPLPQLADVRGRLGLSLVAMGELLGVSRMTVDRVERGTTRQLEDVARWAAAYQLDVDAFEAARSRGR